MSYKKKHMALDHVEYALIMTSCTQCTFYRTKITKYVKVKVTKYVKDEWNKLVKVIAI